MKYEQLKNMLTLQDRPDLVGIKLYTGSFFNEQNFFYDGTLGKMGFKYIDGFLCEPYLMIWVNPKKLSILTYCEGDLSLAESENLETFKKEIKESIECLSEQFEGSPEPEIVEMI
jgi:hypothetical protein